VTDALNRKAQHTLNTIMTTQLNLLRELEDLDIQLVSHRKANVQMPTSTLQSSLMEEIRVNQHDNPELQRIKQNLEKGIQFQWIYHEIPSYIVYDRDQRFQACYDQHFKEPLNRD